MRSKNAIKNLISSFMLQVITLICGFIVPRLIIQSFGSNVNGLVTSITKFLAYITLLESGFGPVVKSVLYKPIANKNKSEIEKILKASEKFFRTIAYIFLVYIIVLSLFLPKIFSDEFDSVFTLSLILIISISTFAEYFFGMTYRLYLHANQKVYVSSIIQILVVIANTVMIIFLIKCGANIQIVKLASAIILIGKPLLQNIYVKKKYKINLKNVKDDYKIKQKWDGLAQHIAYVIHINADVIILTLFSSTAIVSVYSIYFLIVSGVKNVIQCLIGGVDAFFGEMIAKKEQERINRNFKIYEILYFTISTIIFASTLWLIIPFVKVYTNGITDVNYIRPLFAYSIVIAEYFWIIRMPYSGITLAAGHFKETKRGAWIEAFSNIIISLVLFFKLGLAGVAIGTLVAMLMRTIEFMYHSSKYILNRSIWYTFRNLVVVVIEFVLISIIVNIIPNIAVYNYLTWILNGVIVTVVSGTIVVSINSFVYKDNIREVFNFVRNIVKGVKVSE